MSTTTLAGPAEFLLEVKKSRHLARAVPVESPQAALDWIAAVSVPDATHNCWAYRVGQDYRFSDDGEPSGTAGRPILSAIDGQGLDGVAVVVTRWFGGIKLGAGGLVRAYGGAAAECLRTAPRRVLVERVDARIDCPFGHAGTAHALLAPHGAIKLDEGYGEDGLHLTLSVPVDALEALRTALRDATRDQAKLVLRDV